MAKYARNISSIGLYHVMIRGVNKQDIFYDTGDRVRFLKLIEQYIQKYNCKVLAYCLMTNHVHILIQDKNKNLSILMQNIVGMYARYFNSKYERVGHLFQERFKSEVVHDQKYLMSLVRYIHRNPEKAKIDKVETYRWSSYKEYLGKEIIIDRKYILNLINADYDVAIKEFIEFNKINDRKEYLEIDNSRRLTDGEAKKKIIEKTGITDVSTIRKLNLPIRHTYIKEIKKIDRITISQISKIIGISRTTIIKIG